LREIIREESTEKLVSNGSKKNKERRKSVFFSFLFLICGKMLDQECKKKGMNIHGRCKEAAIFSTAG